MKVKVSRGRGLAAGCVEVVVVECLVELRLVSRCQTDGRNKVSKVHAVPVTCCGMPCFLCCWHNFVGISLRCMLWLLVRR